MVAQTIMQQLGPGCLALLGAHTLVDLGDGLQFRFEGCDHINLVQIILAPSDTYTVKFVHIKKARKKELGVSYTELVWNTVSSHSYIYWDMLHDLIEEETGLKVTFEASS